MGEGDTLTTVTTMINVSKEIKKKQRDSTRLDAGRNYEITGGFVGT